MQYHVMMFVGVWCLVVRIVECTFITILKIKIILCVCVMFCIQVAIHVSDEAQCDAAFRGGIHWLKIVM